MDSENEKDLFEESTEPSPEAASSEAEAEVEAETQPEAEASDGEYHFIRPESKLYEDAGYVPSSEDTEVPQYFVPEQKKEKQKREHKHGKGLFLRTACLCLVCAILGGLVGGFVMVRMTPSSESTPIPIATNSGNSETPSISAPSTISTGTVSANDIYTLGCQQSVGITTEVTTTNWFGQTSSTAVSGSGFVVTADGYIMTNYHVIEYAYNYGYKVTVMFYDGTSYEATVVGGDENNDIAVLKINAAGLNPVTVGNSDNIMVGETVYAIGNPLGELAFSMSTGSVSALDRSIQTSQSQPSINMFQIDAAVNSGNSGGPLYNANGEVIGVVTAKYESSGVEGLGFAIPINDAVNIANDLITKGYVTGKAYMGVSIDTRYTQVYADFYKMPVGAYVFNVEQGSCAEKCGLCNGDIITKLGDSDITGYTDLESAINSHKAGDSAELTVYRSNAYLTLTIVFDEAKPTSASNSVNKSGVAA